MKKPNQTFDRKPSAKYSAAVEAMRALIADTHDTGSAERAFAEAVCERREASYMKTHRRVEIAHICIQRLLTGRCPGLYDRSGGYRCESPYDLPGQDHLSEWRAKDGSRRIISQPYSLPYPTLKELVAYCERMGLEVDIDAWRSWHFPGQTLFMEFQKAEPEEPAALFTVEPLAAPQDPLH